MTESPQSKGTDVNAAIAAQLSDERVLAQSGAAAAVVAARDLVRRYGEGDTAVDALRGVSLEIAPGRLTAVMGPSGSGKSTLMHILAGLDKPTSGTVDIAGQDITKLNDTQLTKLRREHIGFVFQFFNLLPMLTAEENVTLPLSIAGEKPDPEWLEQLLKDVGLTDRRSHRPSELSGGQQQRVAIARGLVSKPTVLFADEPTGNLDSATSAEILELMRSSVEQLGQTTVMVTHDARAATIADRILFLADGRIVRELGRSTQEQVLEGLKEVSSVSLPADGGAGLRPAGADAGQGSEVSG
jgi:putative ABC transport system ATP-binding protein